MQQQRRLMGVYVLAAIAVHVPTSSYAATSSAPHKPVGESPSYCVAQWKKPLSDWATEDRDQFKKVCRAWVKAKSDVLYAASNKCSDHQVFSSDCDTQSGAYTDFAMKLTMLDEPMFGPSKTRAEIQAEKQQEQSRQGRMAENEKMFTQPWTVSASGVAFLPLSDQEIRSVKQLGRPYPMDKSNPLWDRIYNYFTGTAVFDNATVVTLGTGVKFSPIFEYQGRPNSIYEVSWDSRAAGGFLVTVANGPNAQQTGLVDLREIISEKCEVRAPYKAVFDEMSQRAKEECLSGLSYFADRREKVRSFQRAGALPMPH